ncbi:MAG: hypothetical protein WC482_00545 [Candidatus Omnitrophota bacterium]|nr:hypothetical protein [Candidatus Omnitrophota bacterium]
MDRYKTKSLSAIEEKMADVDEGSLRYKILSSAKSFKTSWIDLGQSLYSVWKDKLFKDWGFLTFDAYTSKEIGIRKNTALKLLKTYYFLEKEEPHLLDKGYVETKDASEVPSYEAVDVLRLAKKKQTLGEDDYKRFRRDVLEKGKDAREVKKDLTALIKQREELEPDEARKKKREATIKRLLTTLRSLKTEIEVTKVLPSDVLKQTRMLIDRIEAEIE